MRILCIDVGTGTQDILLFDSSTEIENCMQMVMPSPTQILARKVRAATEAKQALFLDGVTMGGGPGAWAVEDHIKRGFSVYATPDAARTFDDDLERVSSMGVTVFDTPDFETAWAETQGEAAVLVHMQDLDLPAVHSALEAFHEPTDYDALAVAAFDHGAAPPGYSDRRFRFDYISRQMEVWGEQPTARALAAFSAPAGEVPADLTRLLAVAEVAQKQAPGVPLLLMDTGPAALLGALGDPTVEEAAARNALFVNVGNFHTLAFHIRADRIVSLFEHHTGLLDGAKLVGLLESLVEGTLTNQQIFDDSGHGALILKGGTEHAERESGTPLLCAVTGPRRGMLHGVKTPWPVYMAVPHGDMMLAGCYGLLRAYAAHFPDSGGDILSRLDA
jgi:uncharacterized protein (DUF1786 family)